MTRLLLPILALLLTATALGAPPRVVRATPDNGDIGVDPGTTEIVITFDQPMSRDGFSVVGGGSTFPQITGQITWRDTRTLVIPVKLQPAHEYQLSINNQRYTNFRNTRGEPCVPYPIRFVTASLDGEDPETGMDFGPTIERIAELMETMYSHRDRLGLDWRAIMDEHRDALTTSLTPEAFANTLSFILARARDKHILIETPAGRRMTYVAPIAPNVYRTTLERTLEDYTQASTTVFTATTPSGIPYLSIESLDRAAESDLSAAFAFIGEHRDAPALILDLRLNSGGDERLAQSIAGCFVAKPTPYAKHVSVDPGTPGAFLPVVTRILEPNHERPRFRGRVAVLTGPVTISSAEAFVLMMKAAGATTIGTNTQGSSGNPRPHDLGHGITLHLPSWRAMTLRDEPFEGIGIEPDIRADFPTTPHPPRDPVLDAAIKALED